MSAARGDLPALYDEAVRLTRRIRDLVDLSQHAAKVTVCSGCGLPQARGGVCGCDVEAAKALGRYEARQEQAA